MDKVPRQQHVKSRLVMSANKFIEKNAFNKMVHVKGKACTEPTITAKRLHMRYLDGGNCSDKAEGQNPEMFYADLILIRAKEGESEGRIL